MKKSIETKNNYHSLIPDQGIVTQAELIAEIKCRNCPLNKPNRHSIKLCQQAIGTKNCPISHR